ncbi:glycoside hydrolase family 108 protein [Sphingopyxis sp. LARHCG72]
MKTVLQLIDEVIDREGAYVNHPADRGGPTCWGITEAVARQNGYQGPMRNLPREQAAEIYRKLYWLKPGFDKVAARAPTLAAELFDTGINMGTAIAAGFLQRALNVLNRSGRDYPDIAVDRAVGPRTLSSLDAFLRVRGRAAEAVLLKAVEALQGERYIALAERNPSQEAFVHGWLANRIGNAG